jgi:hypothetical protein
LLKEIGPLLLQGNIGWSRQVSGNREAAWNYNWAAAVRVYQRKVYLLAEINGDWGNPNHAAIAPGIKYFLTENLRLVLRYPLA